MEVRTLLLRPSSRLYRRKLWERILAVEILRAFLDGGFEMRYACGQLRKQAGPLSRAILPASPAELFEGADFPPSVREALQVLENLYKEARPVRAVLAQLSELLLQEHEAAAVDFASRLPGRIGAWLLFFFLPPAMLLLLAPLCLAFSKFY
ncbi:MAG: hypothetical protein H6617_11515 [Bdellovibrionaceae bacterium]|nr:hypothetical protein [Pseudobdellovibrionaceae bacterium]